MPHRSIFANGLLALWVLTSATGCHFNKMFARAPMAPQVLHEQPQLADVAAAVNANAAKVRSLKATQATVALAAGPMPVTLNADIALERPRRFRMKATQALLGVVADVGSNDELLWFWTKAMNPPALYFCRHDQFHRSPARGVMPLEPDWVVEAFGLATFENNGREHHQGPFPDEHGRLKIHTVRQTPSGPVTKVTIVDPRSALILEQHLFNQQGKLLISAVTSHHQQDPRSGAWLPRKIDLTSNTAGQKMTMSIQLAGLEVNSLGPGDLVLWQKPRYQDQGAPDIDLGNPNLRFPGGNAPFAAVPPPMMRPQPRYRPGARRRLLRRQ